MVARKKTALITGASRGLGFAIAEALVAAGFRPILVGRDEKTIRRAAAKLDGAIGFACDVRNPESVRQLAAQVRKSVRHIDVLVNNAGIAGPNAPIAELSFDTWREVMQTNLDGTFLVTQAMLPVMRSGSTIVNILSVAARKAFPGMAAYNSSKRGLLGFTDTLREEVRSQGIRVLALLPGAIDTDIWQQFWPQAPRRKMMSPQTIATAVAMAVTAPANASFEEIVVRPTVGTL